MDNPICKCCRIFIRGGKRISKNPITSFPVRLHAVKLICIIMRVRRKRAPKEILSNLTSQTMRAPSLQTAEYFLNVSSSQHKAFDSFNFFSFSLQMFSFAVMQRNISIKSNIKTRDGRRVTYSKQDCFQMKKIERILDVLQCRWYYFFFAWYLDGSKMTEGTGVEIYGLRPKHFENFGKHLSIFQKIKMYAIEALKHPIPKVAMKTLISSYVNRSRMTWECLGKKLTSQIKSIM